LLIAISLKKSPVNIPSRSLKQALYIESGFLATSFEERRRSFKSWTNISQRVCKPNNPVPKMKIPHPHLHAAFERLTAGQRIFSEINSRFVSFHNEVIDECRTRDQHVACVFLEYLAFAIFKRVSNTLFITCISVQTQQS